jgi:hypothetical protein
MIRIIRYSLQEAYFGRTRHSNRCATMIALRFETPMGNIESKTIHTANDEGIEPGRCDNRSISDMGLVAYFPIISPQSHSNQRIHPNAARFGSREPCV